MREISLEIAQHYINDRLAGFYAHRAQSPIAHPHTMCVFADSRWWLIENGEFQIEDQGIVILLGTPPGWMRAQHISVDDQHPIVAKLLSDLARDAGPDLPEPVSVYARDVVESARNK